MNKTYSRINWENEPSIVTPINEVNLNRMDSALNEIDNRVVTFDTTKANQTDLLQSVNNVTYDQTTGKFTFSFHNGTIVVADLNIEKIPVSFSMDANGIITMETADGTKFTADVSSLIKTYTFSDSSDIDFIVTTDASGNKTVEALIVDGSITANKLQPNYLADITVQAGIATNSANDSKADALVSEGFAKGTQNGVPVASTSPYYHNNAEYFKDQANVTSLGALTDVDINLVKDKEVLTYNANTSKWENKKASGGVLPRLHITSESGSTVTVTDGNITLYPVESSGIWEIDVPTYGVWTVHSVNALGDATATVNVDAVKIYNIDDSHFNATITVSFPSGATCSISKDSETYYANTNPYTFSVHSMGIWTVKAEKDGETTTKTVNIVTDGQAVNVTLELPTITVQLEDDLIGDVVEVTDGVKTKSWVSTSNTHSFAVSLGNWVVSVIHDGKTITKNVNVTEVTEYIVQLKSGFNYEEWLTLGNITESYSSLEEVLADEKTVRQLMLKHASVDYMVEALAEDTELKTTLLASNNALKWIGLFDYCYDNMPSDFISDWINGDKWAYALKDSVPIMTGAKAPYGEAIGSACDSSNPLWKAFDNNDVTEARLTTSSASAYIGFKFTNPTSIQAIDWYNGATSSNFDLELEYSDDGTNYNPAETFSNLDARAFCKTTNTFGYHLYWRVKRTRVQGAGYILANSLNFYGRSLNVSVPKMDSNTSPWGEALYEETPYESSAFNVFDQNTSTKWATKHTNAQVSYIGYDFKKATNVKYFSIQAPSGTSVVVPTKIVLQGTNDTVWHNIQEYTVDAINQLAQRTYVVDTDSSYKKYRLACTDRLYSGSSSSAYYSQLAELQFYGLDYSEREDRTYIYDKGVELVPLTKTSTSILADIDRETKTLLRAEVGNKATNTDKIVRGSGNSTFASGTNPYNWYLDIKNLNGTLSTGFSQVADTSDISCWLE